MKRFLMLPLLGTIASLLIFTGIAAAAGYSLFGDAQIVSPGNSSPHAAQLRSDAVHAGYGGVDFQIAGGTKFADIQNLALDYMFTAGSCGGGAPRFQINVLTPANTTVNAFVYIGPPPNYTGCPPNVWTSSGNLALPASFVDTSQLGGTFYDTFAHADTLYGNYSVTGVQLVTDAGWAVAGGTQTVVADNVNVNGTIYTFDQPQNRDECKDGSWQHLTRADGSPFKNQGDCIQYVNTGK